MNPKQRLCVAIDENDLDEIWHKTNVIRKAGVSFFKLGTESILIGGLAVVQDLIDEGDT